MFTGLPALSYEKKQQVVEHIQGLIADGMSSSEAIEIVVKDIRKNNVDGYIPILFEEEE